MRFSIAKIVFSTPLRNSLVVSILSLTLISPAHAKLDELYQFSLGTYLSSLNSVFNINSNTDSEVDLEDDLGFNKDVSAGWIGARYRVGDNHRIQLKYLPISRSTLLTNNRDILIDNTTIKAGATINGNTKMSIYDFSYIYSLYKTPKLELGLSAGLYILDYKFDISASGEILAEGDDQPIFRSDYQSRQKLLAPMPLFGLTFDYEIKTNWRTIASLRYFTLKVNRISGFFTSAAVGTEYYWSKNWGIGASFSFFSLELNLESIVTKSALVWEHRGTFLYVVYKY